MTDLDEVYSKFSGTVTSYLLRLCGNQQLAEELTQETFYQAVRCIGRFDGKSSISTWLCSIARHLYYDYLRKQKPTVPVTDTIPSPEDFTDRIENRDQAMHAHRVLHALEEPFREVFTLRTFCDLSHSHECAIVRDLMPPVLDRVASRESLEFVENHILTCEECRKQYEEMKADLPEEIRAEYEEEQGKYKEVLRSVRKTRLRRRILALVLAAVLCFAAVIGGRFAYDRLFVEPSVIVSPNDYPVMLSRLKDGSVVVTADIHKLHFNRVSTSETVEEDGKRILYLYYLAAPIRSSDPDAGWKQQKEEMNHLSGETNYSEIHTGLPGHSILIWKEGDPIPAASEEMETYYALEEECMQYIRSLPPAEAGETRYMNDWPLYSKLEEAQKAVPEWQ